MISSFTCLGAIRRDICSTAHISSNCSIDVVKQKSAYRMDPMFAVHLACAVEALAMMAHPVAYQLHSQCRVT